MAESGWIIESKINGTFPKWFCLLKANGSICFTVNPNSAIRFARKVDADLFIKSLENFRKICFSKPLLMVSIKYQWEFNDSIRI